jgi:Flp pilus assembly protein TadG
MGRFRRLCQNSIRQCRDERGQAYAELVIVLPLVLLLGSGSIFFGRALYVALAVDAASFDGARAAVETLTRSRGPWQGDQAVRATLSGYYLDAGAASIQVAAMQPTDRGTLVCSLVAYDVNVSDIPLVHWFFGGSGVRLSTQTFLTVDYYKSRWTDN